jgi:hypothetical protein
LRRLLAEQFAGAVPIEFEEAAHRYTVGGKTLQSVHGIMEAAHILKDVSDGYVDDYYLDRGTQTSRACDLFVTGRLNWKNLDPELRGAVEAYAKFCREYRPLWLTPALHGIAGVETRLGDPSIGVAGTTDRLGFIRGRLWIVDLKRGSKAKWHAVQTAAYARLLTGAGPREIQLRDRRMFSNIWPQRGSLYLKPDASYKFDPHTRDAVDHARFMAAVVLAGFHLE